MSFSRGHLALGPWYWCIGDFSTFSTQMNQLLKGCNLRVAGGHMLLRSTTQPEVDFSEKVYQLEETFKKICVLCMAEISVDYKET